MHTLARTSRWLMVNRDRNRERLAKVIEQRDEAQARAKRSAAGRAAAGFAPGRGLQAGPRAPTRLRSAALGPTHAVVAAARQQPSHWLSFRRCRATWSRAVRDSSARRWLTRCWPTGARSSASTRSPTTTRASARRPRSPTARSNPAFELVEHDLGGAPPPPAALEGTAGIFHLAARPGVRASWGDGFEPYLHDNVLATHRVAESAAARGLRLVFASSSSVYGDALSLSDPRGRALRRPCRHTGSPS